MNQKGVSLIAVIAVTALIGIAVYLLVMVFFGHSRFTSRMNRKAQGDEILARSGAAFQSQDFDRLLQICTAANAFAGPIPGPCITGTALNLNLPVPPNATDATLNVNRNYSGELHPRGEVCVQLELCRSQIQGRILEVTLRGYWPDPVDPTRQTASRLLSFRRARW